MGPDSLAFWVVVLVLDLAAWALLLGIGTAAVVTGVNYGRSLLRVKVPGYARQGLIHGRPHSP